MDALEVLLVEDNAGDAIMMRRALYEWPVPVNLHVARDGQQALLMLTNPHVPLDLIILDLNLPKVTGTALLQRWPFNAIPVVVFSSSTNPTEKERCLALGAHEFVLKPTDLDKFNETVCRIVEKWAMPWAVSSVLL
jgi:CheY-like chemotaxis protein